MPQEFQILRCCDCEKFQVHHVKKANKWQCKVCGLKQSLKRAFFIGSSRDCRVNVQNLNFQAGEQEMKRKLGESCNSTDVLDDSLESVKEDFDFPTEDDWVDENDGIDENHWVDENDGIAESDWVDENDWIDEDDRIDENPADILHSNGNSQNDFEDELPRKKRRHESYSESETAEEDTNAIQLTTEDVEDHDFLFASVFKSKQDGNSSKSVESANNVSSAHTPKRENEQDCDSVKNKEQSSSLEVAKSKPNSILKPTRGFQLILNEAKKQRTHLSYDLD